MKKFLIGLALLIFSVSVAFSQSSVKVSQSANYIVTNKSKVISTASDSIEYHVYDFTEIGSAYYYDIPMQFNSAVKTATSTSPNIDIYSQYSYDGINYTNIDTVTYGCTADTSFVFLGGSTAVRYPYLRIYMDGADSISARWVKIIGRFVY